MGPSRDPFHPLTPSYPHPLTNHGHADFSGATVSEITFTVPPSEKTPRL
jgi:hypothetical protein